MGKLRKWFFSWFDKQVEKSFQRQADRLFMKHKVKTTDGDTTWHNMMTEFNFKETY